MRTCLKIRFVTFLSATLLAFPCYATAYKLSSLVLSEPIPNELKQYFNCVPRIEFDNTLECSAKSSAPSGIAHISGVLIDSSNGNVLFASDKSYHSGGLAGLERSVLADISGALGGTPKRFSVDNAVVAVWGDVKLEKIAGGTDEYNEIHGGIEPQYGLLVDMMADFKATKDATRPVYRVIGGDGVVVILAERTPNQVAVQRLLVTAGKLSEANFVSQVRQFLARDEGLSADDYSRWPEIAFMIRRLALSTTETNANRVVDEVFSRNVSRKYYSHIWAFLPTSVIKHLKDGEYMSIDIFGEKTEFPEIRDKIVAELKASPGEPFSEFLLYTLGRFDEAFHFNQRSPVHTVLAYAFAHSNLRNVMTDLFHKNEKPGDREMLYITPPRSYRAEIDSENIQFQSATSITLYDEATKMVEHNRDLDSERFKEKTEQEINFNLTKKDFFNGHAYERIKESTDPYRDNEPSVTQYTTYLNEFPERYNSRPMIKTLSDFISLTGQLIPQFEEVLKDAKSPHFDDAAYFLGWLLYHRGDVDGALDKFELAITLIPKVGVQDDSNTDDYAYAAVTQTSRILRTLRPDDAISRVQNNKVLSSRPELWYAALASLYHSHNFQLVTDGAPRALRVFGVEIETLPVTTDPQRIQAALAKSNLAGYLPGERELQEIIYLYNASREAEQFKTIFSNIGARSPQSIAAAIKAIVLKYSLTKDSELQTKSSKKGPLHRDLRQGIYLAQLSLDQLPRRPEFSKLREWLHYKRITLLAQFDPPKVAAANAALREEFPDNSVLLNDGLAEQVFAEAIVVGDMVKATAAFNELRQRYPTGNAVDNAYSWMAIGWTCAGRPDTARGVNQEIVRLFPSTRHAGYARQRLRGPHMCSDMDQLYQWDYQAMGWRERNRIALIQASLETHRL